MTKPEETSKKRSGSPKILSMALPDLETRAFWALTSDDPHEYAGRIAKFSRSVRGKPTRPAQPSERRWRDAATAPRSQHGPGRMLVMPTRSDLSSALSRQGSRLRIGYNNVKTWELTQGGNMKAPGIQAKKRGTKVKRGRALQIMCYPRAGAKAALVEAARDVNRPVSSFMVLASLQQAAALRGCEIKDLVAADELEQYRKSRVYRRRSKAAKRALLRTRAKRTGIR
jgi:hypothetical protein